MDELRTASHPTVQDCTGDIPGVRHDWRRFAGRTTTHYRCLWCKAVACGAWSDPDPCWEPRGHTTEHVSRGGVVWPVRTTRA